MSLSSRVSRLVPDLAATLERFPACVLAALAMCIVANLEAADVTRFDQDRLTQIYFAGAAGFLAGGVGHLFALGRVWSTMPSAVLGLVLGGLAALLCYFYASTGGHPLFILPALTLALMVAAYLRRDTTEEALWLFNARLGMALGLAIVITLIFGGGISAILASLDYLFEIDVDNSLYEHTWVTGAALIGPVYGLSLMPADLDEELVLDGQPGLLDRGISVLVNYVMVPIAAVYVVILHLYAAKIAWTWELPKGQIGIMVLLFGLGGTATYLIAKPWRGRGTALLRWFLASWFWFTIVPAILLGIAVWKRVSEYGVTPDRYGLVLIGAWLVAMAAYLALKRRRAESRVILATLGALLLAASFGPWGARDLSVSSQIARLAEILQEHGYLQGNRLVEDIPAKGTIPPKDVSDAYSIIRFLRETKGLNQLEPLFAGRDDSPFEDGKTGWQLVSAINGLLHLERSIQTSDGGTRLSYIANSDGVLTFGPDIRISGPHVVQQSSRTSRPAAAPDKVALRFDGDDLVITHGTRLWRVDKNEFLDRAGELRNKDSTHRRAFSVEASNEAGTVRLLIYGVSGQVGGTNERLTYLQCWVLLPAE